MPCTAKKYEASREEFVRDGVADVDYSITTRELGRLLKQYNINLLEMPEGEFAKAVIHRRTKEFRKRKWVTIDQIVTPSYYLYITLSSYPQVKNQ